MDIQRKWQHWVHKTQDEDKQKTQQQLNATTTFVGHHYAQTNTNVRKQEINHPTYNWSQRRIEHRFYAEIVMDIITRNRECKDIW